MSKIINLICLTFRKRCWFCNVPLRWHLCNHQYDITFWDILSLISVPQLFFAVCGVYLSKVDRVARIFQDSKTEPTEDPLLQTAQPTRGGSRGCPAVLLGTPFPIFNMSTQRLSDNQRAVNEPLFQPQTIRQPFQRWDVFPKNKAERFIPMITSRSTGSLMLLQTDPAEDLKVWLIELPPSCAET